MESKSAIDWKKGDIAVIKEKWEHAGRKLKVLGPAIFSQQWWVPVLDKEEHEDPVFHKEAGLEKKEITEMKEGKIYYLTPQGDIAEAPFVPRGIHRISKIKSSKETESIYFQVVGGTRWHMVDMFDIEEIKGVW